jgi:hypothetical protein
MNPILSSSNFPDIRTLVNATALDLSDSDLNSLGLVTHVNYVLNVAIPNISSLGADDQNLAKIAGVYYCAALCCPVLAFRYGLASKYKLAEYEESYSYHDWDKLEMEFTKSARSSLLMVSTLAITLTRRNFFNATGPSSSGANWPQLFQQWYARIRPRVVTWAQTGGLMSFEWLDTF